jgi:fructokinase
MKIVSVGDILWDVFEGGEHLGGATFNFSAHAAQLGHEVSFVSAVGDDDRGRRALERMQELGLTDRFMRTVPDEATGHVTVEMDDAGQPNYTIHRPAAYDYAGLAPDALRGLAEEGPDWVYFGTLHQMADQPRQLTAAIAEACAESRRFYDVNLRKDSYTPELVESLLGAADVVKLNDEEVAVLSEALDLVGESLEEFCHLHAELFGWEAVCVTRGAAGSSALIGDSFVEAPGEAVTVADTVGAGDAFSAAFLHGLDAGWASEKIVSFANQVGALVASREGAIPTWSVNEL